ncbi:restriction endonuclease [Paenibacillus sp. A3]|uniref:restriction endonuclease n=1 Tax=Paenibacillus sp. A3 TaxID=1337054 RepID=UPI0006D5A42E|nr:restriction endonuclease [Paenibacillus sp. A3]
MTMPSQTEIEIPLLRVLESLGGKGKPKEIYQRVTTLFPELTPDELEEKIESGGNKWTNRIQWVRMKLITKGDVYSPKRGVWAITEQGRNRISNSNVSWAVSSAPSTNLVELYDSYEEEFKSQLLEKLYEITPRQFEEFAKKLLHAYGFINLFLTKISKDGGIDGYGRLKIGLASMNVAFQCKRWQGKVGRKEIQQFRGAIQGKYEQGIFFTTSDFTEDAKNESFQKGAVPIILLNGESIVQMMIEKGLGVMRKPLYLFYEKFDEFMDN